MGVTRRTRRLRRRAPQRWRARRRWSRARARRPRRRLLMRMGRTPRRRWILGRRSLRPRCAGRRCESSPRTRGSRRTRRCCKSISGNPISFPLAVQAAPLAGGGRALLFQSGGKDHNPFILVLDGAGQSLWIKERPLAGIVPGVTEMVLVPASKGDVLLSWYDPPSKIIAGRHWDARGSILVDFRSCTLMRARRLGASLGATGVRDRGGHCGGGSRTASR